MKTEVDRELLELAAKAAGIEGCYQDGMFTGIIEPVIGGGDVPWNPLKNDGQALRLAVKLRMDVKQWNSLAIAAVEWDKHAEENTTTQDPCAATRRAIVRAAASIGKAMQ
jgi:hypothetical protein